MIARYLLALSMAVSLIAGTCAPSFAAGGQTGNVNGTLMDATTQAVIAGAKVTASSPSNSASTTTDSHGFFGFIGLPVDTYTLTVTAPGYDIFSLAGVTVQGDQTVNVGSVTLRKALQQIGRTQARSASSVFQRNQTVDQYTVTGDAILQTTGKAGSTNENDLLLAVPGVTLTNTGGPTIRGGLRTEVGYQLDGINFTEPFFSQNGGLGKFTGLGTLQVVEGAGDATQANVGSGVINLIPKRGTYPSTALVSVESGGPNFNHQVAIEYGWATPDNRFSDYVAYNGQRSQPYAGGRLADASSLNNFFTGTQYQRDDVLENNFVYKFGRDKSQSLQVLYLNQAQLAYGNLGGPNPFYTVDPNNVMVLDFGGAFGFTQADFTNLIGVNPDVPGPNGSIQTSPHPGGLLQTNNQTRYLKFEYDNNFNSTTFLQAKLYNYESMLCTSNDAGSTGNTFSNGGVGALGRLDCTGGPRVGGIVDLTKQFGDKNIVTLSAVYETSHPVWNDYDPEAAFFLLAANNVGAFGGCAAGPCLNDFQAGGYLSTFFPGGVPRIPNSGINYNGAFFQQFGLGLRWQYSPTNQLHFDLGVREDQQRQHYGFNPFNPTMPSNPSDVTVSSIGPSFVDPVELQPRLAASYSIDNNDSVRFGYGRSAVFLNAQTAGTPAGFYGYAPLLNVPAKPGFTCGSGVPGAPPVACTNYAQQIFWLYDQHFDAPDLGGGLPAIYSNYDFTYSHLFKNGWGMKLTPFYKLGTHLPSFALVKQLSNGAAVFTVNNEGLNRTTGAEFGLNTPDKPRGLSGFLSMTYQNVLGTTPPLIGGEDALPINGSGSLILGDVYRSGYISPFTTRLGVTWKHLDAKGNGWRVNPILQYDRGYPYSVGSLIASSGSICDICSFGNIPQVNFGVGVNQIPAFQASTGTPSSTQYYDPAYSGNNQNPNIIATRGTPQTSASGGVLWKPNLQADLVIEYKHARSTFGIQFQNLFGNAFNNQVPIINPYYQPVATGLAGPQTGQNPNLGLPGFANVPKNTYAFDNGAYLLFPLAPMQTTVYYQFSL